ncbi:hypothetical protein [Streptomyces sp. NPDC048551]|uniref:hypothetical protein n=1 Tax=Streptomyces sp. NPDC048551 TaxID=3155758 RepID=UPI00343EF97A
MQRPPELTEEEWADHRQCQAEENTVLTQVVDREAQLENGLIDSYDEYDFSWDIDPAPDEQTWPSRLEVLAEDFRRAKSVLALLDEAGRVPANPLGPALLDQARHAQGLAATAQRAVSALLSAPGLPPAMTTAVLVPLSAAAAHAASAVQHFADATAIAAGSSGRLAEHLQWRIVFHHADGRRELGRAAETSLTAATEFTGRAELRRQLLPRPVPASLPPTQPVTASNAAPKRR